MFWRLCFLWIFGTKLCFYKTLNILVDAQNSPMGVLFLYKINDEVDNQDDRQHSANDEKHREHGHHRRERFIDRVCRVYGGLAATE